MKLNFYDQLYDQLQADIAVIHEQKQEPLTQMAAYIAAVRRRLEELKAYVLQHPFKDQSEEIHFFKSVKPRFYALKIFYLAKYQVDTHLPAGDSDTLRAYYMEELGLIRRELEHLGFHFQYYRLGATELDALYFVRGAEMQSLLIPEVPELDPQFSTNGDYVFAKIKAAELVQEYLLGKLNALSGAAMPPVASLATSPELKWTGDKVNLVEVIYALYFTGQLNHGNADLALIIQFMEKNLQVDLSRTYRDFIDIRNRKVSSPTRYIDQMRESIHKRIDEDMAFKPIKKHNRPAN
ncbi:hypothetical protein BEL04_00145 [Mucilaginibacter sp. PPCGB 2223]|uniref:RteC domain-containing protein n=1 Tax=Mucilaginibacter sp. PPCGB 2223 TaxID=1886027 RepID=UPI000825EF3E|nr:RteC domain-containing protein [Mucilaginibacter sp. PPCGB 2223]OCX52784.1 hypothetical protein BEL04_00145 [Mucilaginibacter sp. PPCGB 2223]